MRPTRNMEEFEIRLGENGVEAFPLELDRRRIVILHHLETTNEDRQVKEMTVHINLLVSEERKASCQTQFFLGRRWSPF